ncbi:hypothetical protein [Actinophytocola sp. KF-1]
MFSDKLYLFLATSVSLVVVVFLTIAGVQWWLGAVVFVPLIVGGLFLKQGIENKRLYERQPQVTYQPPPPPQPTPPASTSVQGLVLPSAQRDYRFVLDVTVLWRATQSLTHPRPDQLAVDAIRERATSLAERESPADGDLLAPRLASELSYPRPDRTGQLEVWAQAVNVNIPEEDRARLRKLAEIRKDEEVWEYERAYERNKRAYLRDDVLSTTGSAVVWWLSRDVTRVPETVDLIGTLGKLVAAAQDREVEPIFRTFVGALTDPQRQTDDAPYQDPIAQEDFLDQLMAAILPNGSEPERTDMADRLAVIATEAGATALARDLRERFNAPDFSAEQESTLFDTPESEPDVETPSPVHPNGQPETGPADTPPQTPYNA